MSRFWRLLLAMLLAWSAAAASSAAEPLGRLFFTPEHRAMLESRRRADLDNDALPGATISLDGIVARSSGAATVWINGRPQHDHAPDNGIRARILARDPGRAILVAGSEAPALLRVGESIDRTTRQHKDVVDGGAVRIRASRSIDEHARR